MDRKAIVELWLTVFIIVEGAGSCVEKSSNDRRVGDLSVEIRLGVCTWFGLKTGTGGVCDCDRISDREGEGVFMYTRAE